MKKVAKRALITVTAIGAVIAVGLATTTIVNAVASGVEADRIEPYGETVSVDGHDMNVAISGDGPETIVLLPGFGTPSPVIDFEPLVDDLAADHRVVVVEPFGYGLSDGTDRSRTTENIVSEVHEALRSLDIDSYVLMGHSIAGIYGIEFAHRYPDEVRAFVGIDTSVPGQPHVDTVFPTGLMGAAKNLGLVRLLTAFGGTDDGESPSSAEAREQMMLLTNRNSLGPTYLDEMSHIRTNFADAIGSTFPQDLPLLLFVVAENETTPEWLSLHDEQAATVADGTVVPLDGEHYLHHTHSTEIADGFRSWEEARDFSGD
ncbi:MULTISPECIES: alpha/beta hydrolase [unclassified Microbacterium]|uniref:alpha/beta hydrolase n=1 Tax=unclassified Microbacterium TaxID=2609290 RepID=UPI00109CADFB|nr:MULTISPECIES: alpha/beta hydrolase [unclassified Microbacterium]